MIVDGKVNKGFVGAYLIDGCIDGGKLASTKKPTRLQRFLAKVVLGWKWVSLKDIKAKEAEETRKTDFVKRKT